MNQRVYNRSTRISLILKNNHTTSCVENELTGNRETDRGGGRKGGSAGGLDGVVVADRRSLMAGCAVWRTRKYSWASLGVVVTS